MSVLATCVGLAIAFEALPIFWERNSPELVDVVIWFVLAYAVHTHILLGQRGFAATGDKIGFSAFLLRSMAIVIIPTQIVGFIVLQIMDQRTDAELLAAVLLVVISVGIVLGLLLALAGSWLPASVVGADRSLGAALRRARRTFFWTLSRLVVGPGVVMLGFWVWIFVAPVGLHLLLSPADTELATHVLILATSPLFKAYATALTAVILSRAFLRTEGVDALAPSASKVQAGD